MNKLSSAVIILGLMLCSCGKPAVGASVKAVTCKMSLTRYYSSTGAVSMPVWNNSDKAGLLIGENSVSASPIVGGSQEDQFLFSLKNLKDGEKGVGYYPYPSDGLTLSDGKLKAVIPFIQDGTVKPCLVGRTVCSNGRIGDITLSPLYATFFITIRKGNYSVAEITMESTLGEGFCGDMELDLTTMRASASSSSLTLRLPTPLDCSIGSKTIALMVAPVTLARGYSITFKDTDGQSYKFSEESSVTFVADRRNESQGVEVKAGKELVFCGDNKIYKINSELADESGYRDAILWQWDASSLSATTGVAVSRLDHIDDCKPKSNGKQLLVTSSYGWTTLLDTESCNPLFFTYNTPNAHSAEILPGDRIVVACSTGTSSAHNTLQLFRLGSAESIFSYKFESAHAVVWNEKTQRLYAAGGSTLAVFRLVDWDSSSPKLALDYTVSVPSGVHDVSYVDENTLCVSGNGSLLFSVGDRSSVPVSFLNGRHSLKSVNYNSETGECWYTDATVPEGTQTWSTQTLRYRKDEKGSTVTRSIKVPDLNVYKVRVLSW